MKRKLIAVTLSGLLAFGAVIPVAAGESDVADKSETVFVEADAGGNVQEITVSEQLNVNGEETEVEDYSELQDIKNTKGDEEYRQDEEGNLLWDSHGENICYEGKSDKELPVSVKVTYYLDGKETSPEKMKGVSGEVKIRFDYENHVSETVETDGKNIEVKAPFTVVSAVLLPSDVFSDVQVTNGKVITEDDQVIVAGIAFPGLADSLKLKNYEPTEDIEIPDYVEVTADAEEFELEFTATVVTAGIFEDADMEGMEDIDDLADSMSDLADVSSKLADGASALADGMNTFGSYMSEYTKGVSAVNDGAKALSEGLAFLNTEKENLELGSAAVQSGLSGVSAILEQIEIPADMEAVSNAAKTVQTDADALSAALSALQSSYGSADSQLEMAKTTLGEIENKAAGKAGEYAKAKVEAVLQIVETELSLSDAQKAEIEKIAYNDADMSGLTDEAKAQLEAAQRTLTDSVSDVNNDIQTMTGLLNSMQTHVTELSGYAGAVQGLDGKVKTLNNALDEMETGVSQLAVGSQQLSAGISVFGEGIGELNTGSASLFSGTSELLSAGGQLNTGFGSLIQGAGTLKEGIQTFDAEGIQKLKDLAGDDLKEVTARFRAVKEADGRYKSYGGIREGNSGEVKFIIETEEIK